MTLRCAVKLGGVVDDAMAQQRPVLHQPEHGIPLLDDRFLGRPLASRRPSPAGLRLAAAPDWRNGLVVEIPHKCRNRAQYRLGAGAPGHCFCWSRFRLRLCRRRRRSRCRVRARRSGSSRMTFREAAGPDFNSADVTAEPTACDERLAGLAAIAPMPRLIGPGACGGARHGAARRGAACRPQRASRSSRRRCCAARWRNRSPPGSATRRRRASPRLGAALRSVENYDDFECRGRNRVLGAKISEHGKGNAIDVRAFTLADGRVDRLDRHDGRQGVARAACAKAPASVSPRCSGPARTAITRAISISISPSAGHGYRICEWDVREPPPPTEVAECPGAIADAAAGDRRRALSIPANSRCSHPFSIHSSGVSSRCMTIETSSKFVRCRAPVAG